MDYKECRLTIGYTYYEEPELLKQQIALWENYPPEVEIVLVDDGSSEFPAYDIVKDLKLLCRFSLLKVNEDLGFNSHGCRNLIASLAKADTVLFSDIDCLFFPNDIAYLRTVSYNKNSLYRFSSYSLSSRKFNLKGHVNVFAVSKEKFWEAGGYDESFTGWHHGDREFMERLESVTKQRELSPISCMIVRGKRKTIIDENASKTEYNNYAMTLTTPIKEKTFAEMKGTVKTKINFSYTQVL